jgi:hypothetical protein
MSGRSPYELWERLGDDERGVFLNALYPGLARLAQHDRLRRDRRTSVHPDIVLAMSTVLGRRENALVRRRPAASPSPQRTIDMPPSQPRLQDLHGGLLDPFRMAANTAVLREHQTQVEVWASTVEEVCRARAMVIALAVGEREAAAHIAMADADIAEAQLRTEQAQTGQKLLAETLPERRDLIRAATTIYALKKGAPQ